jgi:hypothetical protein
MAQRDREWLIRALRAAGCDRPEQWADSEVSEGIPQLARFLLCKSIWENAIEPWRQPNALDEFRDAQELIAAGVDPETLRSLAGKVAYETMTIVVNTLDEGQYVNSAELLEMQAPGWMIMEVDGSTDEATGRDAGAIHESILSVDPTGTEGAEFRE